jgi:hypothetical protein
MYICKFPRARVYMNIALASDQSLGSGLGLGHGSRLVAGFNPRLCWIKLRLLFKVWIWDRLELGFTV